MLSKEEIEKAKEIMKFYKNHCLNIERSNIENYETVNDEEFIFKNIETLLQYIDQLEADNYESNKILNEYIEDREKQNKIIDAMAEQLSGLPILDIKKAEYITLGDKEDVKQYFEKKVEEK